MFLRHTGDICGEVPRLEDALANLRMDARRHLVEGDGVGQQLFLFFGIGQDRQHADLVHQTCQQGAIGHETGVLLAQRMTDGGDLGALAPDLAHLAVHGVAGGLEHLLHGQARGQIRGVVDAQAADGHLQIGDLLVGAQQRAVHHLDQAGREGRVHGDHPAQFGDTDVRVLGRLSHLQRHLRQGGQHHTIGVYRVKEILDNFFSKRSHDIPV
ncbi:hypothetical protein Q3H58_004189 [Pseudomonas psychrotolerans]|nr:hypothetical protein [Pseudomonas psychrotolerans]